MRMTLEQVRDAMIEEKAWARGTGWPMAAGTLQRWADSIDAHLTRQSEGVSEEDVNTAYKAAMEMAGESRPWLSRAQFRTALATVWHNRPAQEKMNPVARVRISESGSLGISALPGMSRKLSHGQDLYTAPPAERVRVPDGWKLVPIVPTVDMVEFGKAEILNPGMDYIRFNRAWKAALSAAPEAAPSPTIDVAAVREVIEKLHILPLNRKVMGISDLDIAKELARAIGDTK